MELINYQSWELKILLNITLKEAYFDLYHWQLVRFHFKANGSYLSKWYADDCYLGFVYFLLTRLTSAGILCLLRLYSFQMHDHRSTYSFTWTHWSQLVLCHHSILNQNLMSFLEVFSMCIHLLLSDILVFFARYMIYPN